MLFTYFVKNKHTNCLSRENIKFYILMHAYVICYNRFLKFFMSLDFKKIGNPKLGFCQDSQTFVKSNLLREKECSNYCNL